jgi:hypothetical protein
VKNSNFAKRHLLMDKVDVYLNVLGATMLHKIGCHVDGRDVIAVDESSRSERATKFLK